MNIGIIIHSKTGHTLNFARKLSSRCATENIKNEIIRLKFEGIIAPRSKKVTIIDVPNIDTFDVLVFGCPVWAFTASPVITAFLKLTHNIEGKKVICFATMGFPFAFLGGIQAISLMNKLLSKSKSILLPGEVIANSSGISDTKTNVIVERLFKKIKQ
jgi:NAD(P)H dehydrogenase (quinone)